MPSHANPLTASIPASDTSASAVVQSAGEELLLLCPACHNPIGSLRSGFRAEEADLPCSFCNASLPCKHGIWRALAPGRSSHFTRFIIDYEFIRSSKAGGSATAGFYLARPNQDLTGNNSPHWDICARTFRYIERNILPDLARRFSRPLRILDLGAGNGWMSYRLSLLGHSPVAVDLLTNDQDGLGAAIHYRQNLPALFPRFQAELDRLPFADSSFDLAIFNASFHYSEDYECTLREALRCIARGGAILIADTPTYSRDSGGQAMLDERRKQFARRFGRPSDSISSLEFLTPRRLHRLSAALGLRWKVDKPWYGLRWALRPWIAHLLGRRAPSRFYIYTAEIA